MPGTRATRRLNLNDLPDVGTEFEPLIRFINQLSDELSGLLDGGIRFGDQIESIVRQIGVRTPTDYTDGTFPSVSFPVDRIAGRVRAVQVLQVIEQTNPRPILSGNFGTDWTEAEGRVTLNHISGLDNSRDYLVRLLIF